MESPKNIIKPDYLSLTTQQIAIGFSESGKWFSTASSFLYSRHEKVFLVTNWHNVTGRNSITGEPLSDHHAGIPDILLTYLRVKGGNGGARLHKIPLYIDEDMAEPIWFVHPTYKEKVDVVAIELERSNEFIYSAINNANFDDDIPPEIGDDSFIIGYPFKGFRYLGLPIWKGASIATEPTVNEDQLPKILVDTATRAGLSGSPVVYQRIGIHKVGEKGQLATDSLFGRIRGFLGVYSGRIGKGEIHAQLGIVWKRHVIDEIIDGNKKGDIEFQKGWFNRGLKESTTNDIFENARLRYKPRIIKYLLVAETPPKLGSKRFFYFENVDKYDSLFIETMKVLYPDKTENIATKIIRKNKKEFLAQFKNDGFYLIDSLLNPFEKQYTTGQKVKLIKKEQIDLLARIKSVCNSETKVILIAAPVYRANLDFLKENGINIANSESIDFPGSGGQKKFRDKFKKAVEYST